MLKNLQKASKLRQLASSSSVFTNFYLSKIFSTHKAPEVEVFVDGKSVKVNTHAYQLHSKQVDPSYTVFQACHQAGVTVPRFCFHERLAVAGNCRMCLVQVERAPKPVASCAIPVMPGMKIVTTSEKTRIARGGVMEFLLANHPLDCPICDQGGECDLQDISQVYGFKKGRFQEYKRAVQDKFIGPLISTSMNRCIHCTRCIRFSQLVAGDYTLGTSGRGKDTQVGTYIEQLAASQLSTNIVDLCPVGALTNKPLLFNARPWEYKSNYSIDVLEGSLQANTEINTRGSELMRILPRVNEPVNQEWISDKSRFGFDGLKRQRFSVPMLRNRSDGEYKELTWEESFQEISNQLGKVTPDQIAGIIGPFVDVEGITAFRDLMHRLGCQRFQVRSDVPKIGIDMRSQYLMNSTIVGVHDADLILFIGTNPKLQSPVFNSRVRRQVLQRGITVGVIGTPAQLNYNYEHIGNGVKSVVEIAEGRHPFCAKIANAKLPMVIVGGQVLQRQDSQSILNALHIMSQNSPICQPEKHWNGFNILHKQASRVGALDLGIVPSTKSSAKTKLVYLLGADDIRVDQIPQDAFVIYQGHSGDEGALFADLILPCSAYTQKSGTYVNTDGRVQLARLAVSAPGQSKDDWMILRALSEQLGMPLPYDDLDELRMRIGELAPHLLKYDHIQPSGFEQLVLRGKKAQYSQINLTQISDYIDNYYMTDAITRNSAIMAQCSQILNKKRLKNFRAPQYD